jgi:hypothetical protein
MGRTKWVAVVAVAILVGVAAFVVIQFGSGRGASSISGYVWVTTDRGESNIQRGAEVRLLKGRVTAAEIQKAAYGKIAEIKRRAAGASEFSGIGKDATAMEAEIAKVKGEVTVYDAILVLNDPKWATYGEVTLSDFMGPATFRVTTADVNGHYEFADVPPGYYIVATRIAGGIASQIVSLGNASQKVDLH